MANGLTREQQQAIAIAQARRRAQGNPMLPGSENAPANEVTPRETGYEPSIGSPFVDFISTVGASTGENIPIAGRTIEGINAAADSWLTNTLVNPIGRAFGLPLEDRSPEQSRAMTDAAQQEFPIADAAGVVAGNVLGPAPLAMTRLGQRAFGLDRSMPLWQRGLAGGTSAGIITGLDSLSEGKAPMDALADAGFGFGAGATAGMTMPWIEDGLSALGRRFGLLPSDAATDLSRPARETLVRAGGADDAFGPRGVAALQEGGPTAMAADAGPALRSVLDTSIQRAGPGATAAREAIEARASQANVDVTRALDETLGTPQGITATTTATRRGTQAARGDAYDRAYATPISYASPAGQQIEALIPRVPHGVIELANRMMRAEGVQSAQIMARVGDDGAVQFMRMPDVRQLDYITRALNQAARSGEGQGALGGMTDIGRIYSNLSREIRDATRTAAPAYDEALRTAAQPIRQIEALKTGGGLLSPSTTRDAAREELAGLTGPELAAVRQGVRSHIDDVVANVRAIVSDPNLDAREVSKALGDLSSRAARDKLAMIVDDPAQANRLFATLGQATRALELRASVSRNSATYGRLAADRAVNEAIAGGPLKALFRGEPLNMGRRAAQATFGTGPAADLNLADEVWAELAEALTRQGVDAEGLLSALGSHAGRRQVNAPWAPGLAQAGAENRPLGIPSF